MHWYACKALSLKTPAPHATSLYASPGPVANIPAPHHTHNAYMQGEPIGGSCNCHCAHTPCQRTTDTPCSLPGEMHQQPTPCCPHAPHAPSCLVNSCNLCKGNIQWKGFPLGGTFHLPGRPPHAAARAGHCCTGCRAVHSAGARLLPAPVTIGATSPSDTFVTSVSGQNTEGNVCAAFARTNPSCCQSSRL